MKESNLVFSKPPIDPQQHAIAFAEWIVGNCAMEDDGWKYKDKEVMYGTLDIYTIFINQLNEK